MIREGASLLFKRFGLRDFARIDGWFLPSSHLSLSAENDNKFGRSKSGTIIFTDINLISGMEQTSFLFQQASKVGFSHSNILRTIIQRACLRFPALSSCSNASNALHRQPKSPEETGAFSEGKGIRKVFVMFGGETSERQVSLMSGTNVWLNLQAFDDLDVTPCMLAPANEHLSDVNKHKECDVFSKTVWTLPYSLVLRHTTEEVLDACVKAMEPDRAALTTHLRNQVIMDIMEGLSKQSSFKGFDIADVHPTKYSLEQWIKLAKEVEATVFIAGPGVIASKTCMDKVATSLAVGNAHGVIEMPNPPPEQLLFEPFIETDPIIFSSKCTKANSNGLLWEGRSRWVEITVGVVGKRGEMHSLSPSVTVKESGDILSLEEKFQGGTGINLTPPPSSIISEEALEKCKRCIEIIANTLGLEGFSRIDAFVNVDSGEALVEEPPMYPQHFFRTLLDLASERSSN
ncbi:hypothetical protein C5167_002426 [Papaver somniferum]|uniref:Uncharacterized protein n=1 Tax=Papaver somniferum TaxID=3469 RepID=A0A4Y7L1V2_PAPSO|nr:hypothetical protein C5167_002426 [Papaver somniferum]